jgi:hypothetical protein
MLAELEVDPAFGPEIVEPLRTWFISLDREADDNPHALACLQCFAMIAAQPYSARERFEAIDTVATAPKGPITVRIKRPA